MINALQRVFFNVFSFKKLPFDKWSFIDLLTAFLSLIAFLLAKGMTEEDIFNKGKKERIDIFMIFVMVVTWLRFFSYFLLIHQVSKLIMTLIKMIQDTMSFLFIALCYLLLASTVFATLFYKPGPEFYGSI